MKISNTPESAREVFKLVGAEVALAPDEWEWYQFFEYFHEEREHVYAFISEACADEKTKEDADSVRWHLYCHKLITFDESEEIASQPEEVWGPFVKMIREREEMPGF